MAKRDWSLRDHYSSAAELRTAVRAACIDRVKARFRLTWTTALEDMVKSVITWDDTANRARLSVLDWGPDEAVQEAIHRLSDLALEIQNLAKQGRWPREETRIAFYSGDPTFNRSSASVVPLNDELIPPCTPSLTVPRQRLVSAVGLGLLCTCGWLGAHPCARNGGHGTCPVFARRSCCCGPCARRATDAEIAHVFLLLQGVAHFKKKLSDVGGTSHVRYVLDTERDSIKSARLDLKRPKAARKRRRSA